MRKDSMETASNNVFRVRLTLSLTDVVDKRENCYRKRTRFVRWYGCKDRCANVTENHKL